MKELNKQVSDKDLKGLMAELETIEISLLAEFKILLLLPCQNQRIVLFASAIVNRGMALIRGFITLTESENYITAVPLIRLQLDNCMRFFAGSIVKDFNDFHEDYLRGEPFRRIKDKKGNRMTDRYLAESLDDIFPGILNLYESTSGYVHLSKEHSFLQTEKANVEERIIGVSVGRYDHFSVARKVDFAYNMLIVSKLLHYILCDLVKYFRDGNK